MTYYEDVAAVTRIAAFPTDQLALRGAPVGNTPAESRPRVAR